MTSTDAVKPRLPWIDAARAISILLVVLLHATAQLRLLESSAPIAEWISSTAQTLRMPVFFFVSGLLATKWMTASWRDLLRSKLLLPIWVYLVWQPVVFAYKLLEMQVFPNAPDNSILTQIGKLILSPIRPNGELWFLWALVLFFVLARLLHRAPHVVVVGIAAAVTWAWFGWGQGFAQRALPDTLARAIEPGWSGFIGYFAFFAVGAYFAPALIRRISKWSAWQGLALFALWLAASVGAELLGIERALALPLRVLGVAGGVGLAIILGRWALVRSIGRATLQVYVAHVFVIVVTVAGLYLVGLAPLLAAAPLLATLMLVAFTVFVTRLMHRLAMRSRATSWLYAPPKWLARKPARA